MPGELPAESLPPLCTVTAPVVPEPPSVLPLAMVVAESAIEPFTSRVPPPETVVVPV